MTTKRISGIGGLFFRSKDNKGLALWYEKHFGISNMATNEPWQQEAGPTVFAPFKEDTNYFANMQQQFMINFRVEDLDGLLETLQAEGVNIAPDRINESYGKFAWVFDPEGNKIELWQPIG